MEELKLNTIEEAIAVQRSPLDKSAGVLNMNTLRIE